MSKLSRIINQGLRRSLGIEVRRMASATQIDSHPDFDEADRELVQFVQPYTLTSPERIVTLRASMRYVCHAGIPGDVVECGVYKGGSSMAAALTLLECSDERRSVWMYDTFEGMVPPAEVDRSVFGPTAGEMYAAIDGWCLAGLDEVKRNMSLTAFPGDRIRYVVGKVEDTIPSQIPEKISLLRLDTDWYSSTIHELEHLWPRLARGGVLIVDDYGHWEGCRKAVDEFFEDKPILLVRVDYTGRIAVK